MNVEYPIPPSTKWHLDRRVPIAIIVTIAIQTAIAIWAAATMYADVSANTQWRIDNTNVIERMARLEERVAGVQTTLNDIKTILRDED